MTSIPSSKSLTASRPNVTLGVIQILVGRLFVYGLTGSRIITLCELEQQKWKKILFRKSKD